MNNTGNHLKKAAALIFAALMTALTACSGSVAEPGTTALTGVAEENTAAPAAAETTASFAPDLPDSDFGGEAVDILYPLWGVYDDFFFKEQDGDVINDAVYLRNLSVEEEINVKVNGKSVEGIVYIYDALNKSVMAGDLSYDLTFIHNYTAVHSILQSRLVLDWNDVKYVDFDKPYWNKSMNSMLEMGGKLPYAASDYLLPDPNCVMYNIPLHESLGYDSLYDMVDGLTWTWERVIELSAGASADLDGDGEFTANDRYGFEAERSWLYASIPTSCDQYIVQKNAEGKPEIVLNNEKTVSIIETVYRLTYENNATYTKPLLTGSSADGIKFDTGRVLFFLYPIRDIISRYRSSEVDFGLLPYPKYDEAQEEYISLNWSGLMCIPKTAADTDMIGVFSELIAYKTRADFMPVYFDTLLDDKVARDEASARMLDIIYDNCVYDYGLNFCGDTAQLLYLVSSMLVKNSTDFASYYAANYDKCAKTYNDAYEMIINMGEE